MTFSAISLETRSSKIPKFLLNTSSGQKRTFCWFTFYIFAIDIEKFNVKVSIRLEFSYIGLGGGGRLTAIIRCAAAS